MLDSNRKELDRLEKQRRFLPVIYKVVFGIIFVVLIGLAYQYGTARINADKAAQHQVVKGFVVLSIPIKRGYTCIIKLENNIEIPTHCANYYPKNQRINVTITTEPSGETEYVVNELY